MPTVLITGAGRGIGLALARRYAKAGWKVHATARAPQAAGELQAIPGVTLHPLDLASADSIDDLAARLSGEPVDHLVNNAGQMGPRHTDFGNTSLADWQEVLTVNTAGPWLVTERLCRNLESGSGRRVGVITSSLGSIATAENDWPAIYAASKAGANMVARQLSLYLAPKGIVVLALHPGWVRTSMGGEAAPTGVEDSADGLFRMLGRATPQVNGGFYDFNGEALPW